MRFTLPRRRFVVTAGLLTGGAIVVPLSHLALAQRAQPPKDDPVVTHAGKEFARLYKTLKSGSARSEHLSSLAGNLRLLAALGPQLDVATRAGLQRGGSHDPQHLRSRMRKELHDRFQMDLDPADEGVPLTAAQEIAARATVAREGVAPTLLRLAQTFDQNASRLASREERRGVVPVQRFGDDPVCDGIRAMEYVAAMACLAAMVDPLLAPTCAALQAAVNAVRAGFWAFGGVWC